MAEIKFTTLLTGFTVSRMGTDAQRCTLQVLDQVGEHAEFTIMMNSDTAKFVEALLNPALIPIAGGRMVKPYRRIVRITMEVDGESG